jgi:zona occludens toxin (predicted ATPase)
MALVVVIPPTVQQAYRHLNLDTLGFQSQADHRNHDAHDAGYRSYHRACLA